MVRDFPCYPSAIKECILSWRKSASLLPFIYMCLAVDKIEMWVNQQLMNLRNVFLLLVLFSMEFLRPLLWRHPGVLEVPDRELQKQEKKQQHWLLIKPFHQIPNGKQWGRLHGALSERIVECFRMRETLYSHNCLHADRLNLQTVDFPGEESSIKLSNISL